MIPKPQALTNKMEQIQHRAARFVVNDYSRDSSITRILLQDLNWTSLKDRRTINRLSILQKARLGLLALATGGRPPSAGSTSVTAHTKLSRPPFCFVRYSLSKQNINMTYNITPVSLPCLPESSKMANK